MLEGGLAGAGAGRRRAHAGPGSLDLTLEAAASALGQHPAWCWGERGQLWEGGEGHQACVLAPPAAPAPHFLWVPTSLLVRPQALRVNGLEQLCNNLGSEHLQLWHRRLLLALEEVREPGWEEAGDAQLSPRTEAIPGGEWALTGALRQSPLAVGCLGPSEP